METTQKPREIQECETVLLELSSVKKNAKIYKQQPNSNIFFLADVNTLKADKERELKKLQAEYEANHENV